jgi:hypothetical protein
MILLLADRHAQSYVADVIEQSRVQDLATPRDRAELVKREGVVRRGRCEDGAFHIAEQLVVVAHQRAGDFNALLHRGLGEPRRRSESRGAHVPVG